MIAGGKELFKDFKVVKDRPVYIQLKDYLKKMIMKGHLLGNQKIPSTSLQCHNSTIKIFAQMLGVQRRRLIYIDEMSVLNLLSNSRLHA